MNGRFSGLHIEEVRERALGEIAVTKTDLRRSSFSSHARNSKAFGLNGLPKTSCVTCAESQQMRILRSRIC
jgi:hypothetical protein